MNALRAFEAAARHSSISKAAAELNVSHSVVSQHVRNLEDWFGSKLFKRSGNRIELTGEGRRLEPQVAHGLQILSDACAGLLQASQQGAIIVSAEPALASRWLRRKITQFSEQFPKIECHLRSDWQIPDTNEHQIDLVIHFDERIQRLPGGKSQLFPVDGFPACAPSLADQLRANDPDSFFDIPIIHDNGRHVWQQWFAEHAKDSRKWTQGKVFSDLALTIDAAIDGEGVFLADKIICKRELDSGQLVQIDSRTSRCTWYSIAARENAAPNSPAETFKSWLIAEVKTHLPA
ncbi:LysR family transcriptional regulator [Phaeobacter gallaeciensis]|uniref:LysR family transcriptional regulator n=1 Tax=Phaeobacter gallaeciensis TaxID=60890 RepID=UPI00131488CE|nr:LysR family transcriptional regulator [Phaeobacter gallaeciensis]